jgi:Flp pilus assembly pilin Flp
MNKHPCRAAIGARARGATLVEYIVLVALVALGCMAAYSLFSESIRAKVFEESGAVHSIGQEP